jgi:hypothetical protein
VNRVHQGYLFQPLSLVERVRLATYRQCRRILDDQDSTRNELESAIVVCDQMVGEFRPW